MATKCLECGHGNDLGHIFCVKCGGKLSLEHVAEDIEDDIVADKKKAALRVLVIFILLAVVSVIGASLWPAKPVKPLDNGLPGIQSNADMQLAALHFIAQRTGGDPLTTRPPMRQNDVNAWLARKGRCAKTRSVTVELTDGQFICRVIRSVGPFKLWQKVPIPELKLSYDVTGKPEGDDMNLVAARIGHMPMFGPLIDLVGTQVGVVFKDKRRENDIFGKLTDIKVADGQIELTVTP